MSQAEIKFALVPITGLIIACITLITTPTIAFSLGHTTQFISAISETGINAPESYFYSFGFVTAGATLLFSMVVLRAFLIGQRFHDSHLISWSFWPGVIASVGLMIQGAFPLFHCSTNLHEIRQSPDVWGVVHLIGANAGFFLCSIIHAVSTIKLLQKTSIATPKGIAFLRNAIICAGTCVLLPIILQPVLGMTRTTMALSQWGAIAFTMVYYGGLVAHFRDLSLVLKM